MTQSDRWTNYEQFNQSTNEQVMNEWVKQVKEKEVDCTQLNCFQFKKNAGRNSWFIKAISLC